MTYIIQKIKEILEAGLDKKDVGYFYTGKPYSLPKAVLDRGAIYINGVSQDIESITTGIGDRTTNIIQITLCKSMQNDNYKNAQKETGNAYLTRVMDGRGESGDVLTNTIRYIIRTNMRNLGITQSAVSIEYGESNDIDSSEATVFATMTLSQEDHQKYILT